MRRRVREAGRRTFRAISVRNYRLYFTGQVISVSGTWMQTVAQAYLILFLLRGTGLDVAIATSLQFLPLLLFGPFGGLIADRLDKRKVLYATQGVAGVLALIFGLLVATHSATLFEVYLLAAGLGFVNLFDNPARQTFVSEMVGLDLLPNAVSLNSVLMNSARVIGPAIGGVLILTVGVGTCFFLNAASYAAVIVALAMMRAAELYRRPGVGRAKGQVRDGLRYVWTTPDLKIPLLSMAVVGVFAFNFTVTLPLLAKFTFHGGAGLYSWFLAAMGAGAVIGGLATAFRSRPSTRLLAGIGVVFGCAILGVALSPSKNAALVLLVLMGATSIAFVSTNNATLQLRADPAMRGRVMSLNAIAFLGSTPIGAPLLGYLSDSTNPRVALAVGGVATLLAAIPLFALGNRQRLRRGAENEALVVEALDEIPSTPLDVAPGRDPLHWAPPVEEAVVELVDD
ncbi:MAG TPA: MFS transporter [Acidimicrobiales bacterium]|nr:MFS transporter [Acidimicrobiales bacterium]